MTEHDNSNRSQENALGIPGVSGLVEIGRGGFGIVYRGVEGSFQRDVAVKVLPAAVDQAARDQFERERLATGTLSGHPNIVTVFRGGFSGTEQPFLVMEYLPGGSLGDRLKGSGALPWVEVTEIGVKLAGALETAHRAGVLHRDIKPGNVFQSSLGEPKLGDFGIARLQGGAETQSSAITASIVHAPPEVISGQKPDQRSDVYALASTLYELLSGSAAFAVEGEESLVPMLARIATADAVAPVVDGAAGPIIQAILKAMQKQPDDRFQSAGEFGEALREAQDVAGLTQTALLVEGERHPMPGDEFGSVATMPASQHTQQIPAPIAPPETAPSPTAPSSTAASVPSPTPPEPASAPMSAPSEAPSGNKTARIVAVGVFALFMAGLAGWALNQGGSEGVTQQGTKDGGTVASVPPVTDPPATAPLVTAVPATLPPITLPTTSPVTVAPTVPSTAPPTIAPPVTLAPIVAGDPLPVDFTEDGVRYSEYTHADGAITMIVPTKWTELREDAVGHPEYAILEGLQPYVGVSVGLSHDELGADSTTRNYAGSGMRVTVTSGPAGQDIDVLMDYEVAKYSDCGEPSDRLDHFILGAGTGRTQFYVGCGEAISSAVVTIVAHNDDPTVYTTIVTQFTLAEISEFDRQSDVVIDPTKVPTR